MTAEISKIKAVIHQFQDGYRLRDVEKVDEFMPPPPFMLSELDPAGLLPDRVYTKTELLKYLAHGRDKCRARLEIPDLTVLIPIRPDWLPKSVAELLLYNMRHVQEHAAQLSLYLGQKLGSAPGWVSAARK